MLAVSVCNTNTQIFFLDQLWSGMQFVTGSGSFNLCFVLFCFTIIRIIKLVLVSTLTSVFMTILIVSYLVHILVRPELQVFLSRQGSIIIIASIPNSQPSKTIFLQINSSVNKLPKISFINQKSQTGSYDTNYIN